MSDCSLLLYAVLCDIIRCVGHQVLYPMKIGKKDIPIAARCFGEIKILLTKEVLRGRSGL